MPVALIHFLFVGSSLFAGIILLKFYKNFNDIKERRNIPAALENFVIHQTSQESYLLTKRKIEDFSINALNNEAVELWLNANDINNVYTRGIVLDRYKPGKFFSYAVEENEIVESRVEWPSLQGRGGCSVQTKSVKFLRQEDVIYEITNLIEVNDKNINGDSNYSSPITYSKLIFFLFGGTPSPWLLPGNNPDAAEYQRTLLLIGKLQSVEICNSYLILRT